MTSHARTNIRLLTAAVLYLGASAVAAQSYPVKPVHVTPYPPGGSSDVMARYPQTTGFAGHLSAPE